MRLKNLDFLLSRVILQGVPGCFLEAGVLRGGVSMYARAVLDLLGEERRDVFLCDSFEGLPPPSTPTDSDWSKLASLKVSEEEVKKNFEAVQISLERVHFVKGYFQQSLPVLRDRFRKEIRESSERNHWLWDPIHMLLQIACLVLPVLSRVSSC